MGEMNRMPWYNLNDAGNTGRGPIPGYPTGPWRNSVGHHFNVQAASALNRTDIDISYSLTGGRTWITNTFINLNPFVGGLSMYFFEDKIYIMCLDRSGVSPANNQIAIYNTLTFALEASIVGLPNVYSNPTPPATWNNADYNICGRTAMAVLPNGHIQIAFIGGVEFIAGSPYDLVSVNVISPPGVNWGYSRTFTSEYDGAVWSAPIEVPGQTGITADVCPTQLLVNNSGVVLLVCVFQDNMWASFVPLPNAAPTVFGCMIRKGSDALQQVFNDASIASITAKDSGWVVGYGQLHSGGDGLDLPYIAGGDGTFPVYPLPINKVAMITGINSVLAFSTVVFDSTTICFGVGGVLGGNQPMMAYVSLTGVRTIVWTVPTSIGGPGGNKVLASKAYTSTFDGSNWSAKQLLIGYAALTIMGFCYPADPIQVGVVKYSYTLSGGSTNTATRQLLIDDPGPKAVEPQDIILPDPMVQCCFGAQKACVTVKRKDWKHRMITSKCVFLNTKGRA